MPLSGSRDRHALTALRIVLSTLIFIHGSFRAFTGGVAGFGEFLNGNHLPFGLAVAWLVTVVEMAGTLTLASGRLVRPLALWFATELTVGIALVHVREGWFVVGGGRNGMEYSVLLISGFLIIAWSARRGDQEG